MTPPTDAECEEQAVILMAHWLRGKSRLVALNEWCIAHGVSPMTFYRQWIAPTEEALRAEGTKFGSLKK